MIVAVTEDIMIITKDNITGNGPIFYYFKKVLFFTNMYFCYWQRSEIAIFLMDLVRLHP